MLKKKYVKILVFTVLTLSMVSVFISHQVIQTTLSADVGLVLIKKQTTEDVDKSFRTNDTYFKFAGYGYSYPAGCGSPIPKGLWKEVLPGSFYILSAFYDTRGQTNVIRIIAAIRSDSSHNLWCHLSGIKSVQVRFHEMSENHNLPFGGWILDCEVPEIISSLCEVTLSTSQAYTIANTSVFAVTVPIFVVDSRVSGSQLLHQRFAVCVPPVFGNIPTKQIVEFFEMMHFLGAGKVFIYVLTDSASVRRVVKYYEEKQYAVLLPWYLPFSDVTTKNATIHDRRHTVKITSVWYNGQLLAANDCLYRTMPHFKYTLFSDLDEVLVPKSELYNWEDIIKEVETDETSGYSFRSAYFEKNTSETDGFDLLSSVRTSQFSPSRNKVMVHPKRVLEVGIHHISRSIESPNKYFTQFVPDTIAFIHHYRRCQREKDLNCLATVVDDTVSRKYKHFLASGVSQTLEEIEKRSFVSL